MKVLDGRPMQFNVTARRSGSDWYIGASTLSARDISIKLSDLIDDDGDKMIESITPSDTSTIWSGAINSNNIPIE